MDHDSMFLVLTFLVERGAAKSGDVAEGLGFKPKRASMVLLRCFRRGFVSRRPYRRGRERGYFYGICEKGAEWILYKVDQRKNARRRDDESVNKIERPTKPEASALYRELPMTKEPVLPEVGTPDRYRMLFAYAASKALDWRHRCESSEQRSSVICLLARREREEASLAVYLQNARQEKSFSSTYPNKEWFAEYTRSQMEIRRLFRELLKPSKLSETRFVSKPVPFSAHKKDKQDSEKAYSDGFSNPTRPHVIRDLFDIRIAPTPPDVLKIMQRAPTVEDAQRGPVSPPVSPLKKTEVQPEEPVNCDDFNSRWWLNLQRR